MDAIQNAIVFIAISLAVFLAVGFAGFRIPAPIRMPPDEPTAPPSSLAMSSELPSLAKSWIYQGKTSSISPKSLVAWGKGWVASRVPIIGKIWLPLSWTLYLLPGESFVMQNRITWFGRRFIQGGEEFRSGKGSFVFGSQSTDAPFLDDTEKALVWLYSIWLTPASLVMMDSVSLFETSQYNLELTADQGQNFSLLFSLDFSSDTGLLHQITGTRKGSRTGIEYPYMATLTHPRNFAEMGQIPTKYTANWDGDIYIKLELAGVKVNRDVSTAMLTGVKEMPPL